MKFDNFSALKCLQNSYYIMFMCSSLNASILLPVLCLNTMNYEVVYCSVPQILKMNKCDLSLYNTKSDLSLSLSGLKSIRYALVLASLFLT